MTYYNHLASRIQSRVSKRAKEISVAENWKVYHRALEQMTDWRATKALIKDLTESQQLDKRVLKVMQELAYYDSLEGQQMAYELSLQDW